MFPGLRPQIPRLHHTNNPYSVVVLNRLQNAAADLLVRQPPRPAPPGDNKPKHNLDNPKARPFQSASRPGTNAESRARAGSHMHQPPRPLSAADIPSDGVQHAFHRAVHPSDAQVKHPVALDAPLQLAAERFRIPIVAHNTGRSWFTCNQGSDTPGVPSDDNRTVRSRNQPAGHPRQHPRPAKHKRVPVTTRGFITLQSRRFRHRAPSRSSDTYRNAVHATKMQHAQRPAEQ